MFAEVFYSKTTETWFKELAKEFIAKYPNVYVHIEQWKNPMHIPYAKEMLIRHNKVIEVSNAYCFTDFDAEAALSNMMMSLESSIFREILQSLFRKRICCVHIHDAIVVPDTKGTEKVEPQQIIDVMKEVYEKYGLCPTFKVE